MTHAHNTPFLRLVLLADAASCVLTGFALLSAGGALERLLGIPAVVSYGAGAALLVFGAAVCYAGTRDELPRAAVWAIVAFNVVWAVESVLAPVAGWLEPNALGQALLVAQAAAVAVVAALQYLGLHGAPRVAV